MKAAPNPLGPWLGRLPCLGQTRIAQAWQAANEKARELDWIV